MTRPQIQHILSLFGETENSDINFMDHPNLNCIFFADLEVYFTNHSNFIFRFDGNNELIYIFPFKKDSTGLMKYLKDASGKPVCDIFDYSALMEFGFNTGYINGVKTEIKEEVTYD